MKKITILLFLIITSSAGYFATAQEENPYGKENTALLIIDIQYFYFPGGSLPLVEPEKAARQAGKILQKFRVENMPVIHIKHNAKSGTDIYPDVQPVQGEKIIVKNEANAFLGTDLLNFLHKNHLKNLIITGMQTQMCVEATTRAARDYGFRCTVVADACATRPLQYDGHTVKAWDVHYGSLATLNGYYARVVKTDALLKEMNQWGK